ncbi:MAG: putative Zn-dependent peptidase [Pirellulaceae bacterium]|jgi:predicted Zn-dependent peptidase
MMWLESTAFSLLLPAGYTRESVEQQGLANLTTDMVQRGCGKRDSRQFVEDLELLGADSSSNAGVTFSGYSGSMPAENLHDILTIYSDLIRRPHLPEDQFEDSQSFCILEARGLEDDLPQLAMNELRRRSYPDPFGRHGAGSVKSLSSLTLSDVQQFWQTNYHPGGAILSVAGNFDWEKFLSHVEQLFGDWEAKDLHPVDETAPLGNYAHIPHESSQTQIGISYPAVPCDHDDYYLARAAVGVLSDGMSSRLFTEVRENRGLCYTVSAAYHALKDRASVMCYAGTTTERAQETLDVTLAEMQKLSAGISEDELRRLKARLKTALIMQQESSRARSAMLAGDWFYLERCRAMQEISDQIDGLNCAEINKYVAANPASDFTIVTLGENELENSVGVSADNA